jgi:hypothetical protein
LKQVTNRTLTISNDKSKGKVSILLYLVAVPRSAPTYALLFYRQSQSYDYSSESRTICEGLCCVTSTMVPDGLCVRRATTPIDSGDRSPVLLMSARS